MPVVGGTTEADYKYPWVVQLGRCHGVLIDPQWVLTAAHCVTSGSNLKFISYRRTDPRTGTVDAATRGPALNVGAGNNPGVFIHADYNKPNGGDNDIALVKLKDPFEIITSIQTVGLPRTPRQADVVGTVASTLSHTAGPLPSGQLAIFRGPIWPSTSLHTFHSAGSGVSLCYGDSGSGFVTVENGRAIVRGIAQQASTQDDCKTPFGDSTFADVFAYRDWILQTIGKNDASLSGNTRVRRSGSTALGVLGIGCPNPYGTLWSPLYVVGVEAGAVCERNQSQTVVCSLDKNQQQTGPLAPVITGFTMKTITSPFGGGDVTSLSFSSRVATYYGPLPLIGSREFTCQIGTAASAAIAPGTPPIFRRGVEREESVVPALPEEPTPSGGSAQ